MARVEELVRGVDLLLLTAAVLGRCVGGGAVQVQWLSAALYVEDVAFRTSIACCGGFGGGYR